MNSSFSAYLNFMVATVVFSLQDYWTLTGDTSQSVCVIFHTIRGQCGLGRLGSVRVPRIRRATMRLAHLIAPFRVGQVYCQHAASTQSVFSCLSTSAPDRGRGLRRHAAKPHHNALPSWIGKEATRLPRVLRDMTRA